MNNRNGTGTALLNGQEWTARAMKEEEIFPEDTWVVVRKICGVKLIVSRKQEEI